MYRKNSSLGQFHVGGGEALSKMRIKKTKKASLDSKDKSELKKMYPENYGSELVKKARKKGFRETPFPEEEGLEKQERMHPKEVEIVKNLLSKERGRPFTEEERLERHKEFHPIDKIEDIENLPPRGTGLKEREFCSNCGLRIKNSKFSINFCEECGTKFKKATSYTDFLTSRGSEIQTALKQLKELSKVDERLFEEIPEEKFENILRTYDKNVSMQIGHWISTLSIEASDIANFAVENMNRYGTEPQMILYAIEDIYNEAKRLGIIEETRESNLKKAFQKVLNSKKKDTKEDIKKEKKKKDIKEDKKEKKKEIKDKKEEKKKEIKEKKKEIKEEKEEKEKKKESNLIDKNFPKLDPPNKIPYSRKIAHLLFGTIIAGSKYRKKIGSNLGTVWDVLTDSESGKRFLVRKPEIDKEALGKFEE